MNQTKLSHQNCSLTLFSFLLKIYKWIKVGTMWEISTLPGILALPKFPIEWYLFLTVLFLALVCKTPSGLIYKSVRFYIDIIRKYII